MLEVRDLRVTRRSRDVLHGIDFDARAGEVVAVIGPNGAGKSTLLKAVVGLLPSEGSIRVDGRDLRVLPQRERARSVGYVPQRSMLRSALRVTEVVAHGRYALGAVRGFSSAQRREEQEAIARALEEAGAAELARRVFTRLSAGEQQRVLLARALAGQTSLILLDEPTAALDVAQSLRAFSTLRALADSGRAVVAVVHGLADARRFADRVVLMREGRVVAQGTPAEVIAPGPVRDVYGVELVEGARPGYELSEAER